jgi:hypothetical protein
MNTPLRAFQAIMALMMLRQLTCQELEIEMRPMTEEDYGQDGRIADPMMIPTTIARVVAFGETQCDRSQRQTIQQLVYWLRDDYEQSHPLEIASLAEDTQDKLATAIERAASRSTIQNNVYPQPGSQPNIGCDQHEAEFKILPAAQVDKRRIGDGQE